MPHLDHLSKTGSIFSPKLLYNIVKPGSEFCFAMPKKDAMLYMIFMAVQSRGAFNVY